LSRQIGAILVIDNSIISTGYNGPPRGIPHCGKDRFKKDKEIATLLTNHPDYKELFTTTDILTTCPRYLLGFKSGEGMELCPAQHAEENCVSNAARNGVSTIGSTLYMNCIIPCQKCLGTLINAGVIEIVVENATVYDRHSTYLIDNSSLKIREFTL
jgi:dCMP deaminase